jgi:PRTRC genetic system protein E
MPLIEKRAITITVAALGDGRIRVNVVLMALAGDTKVNVKVGYANKDKIAQVPESAIHALTTPLSLTGEPAEIDAQMAEQLKACVDCHGRLQQSVERAKQEIADAVKAIEERDKVGRKASRPLEFASSGKFAPSGGGSPLPSHRKRTSVRRCCSVSSNCPSLCLLATVETTLPRCRRRHAALFRS